MDMRKILITNDDGIEADGLKRLVRAAREYGDVWVVAPDGQRSAASHSITLHKPMDVMPYDYPIDGVKAFAVSGTPADCVRVGSLALMQTKPDVVLSGINHGYNVASDIQYSATVGAAFEASFQGYPGIALSQGFGECHEVADFYLRRILGELIDKMPDKGVIWNVNFPDCTLDACKGILYDRAVSHGMFYRDHYNRVEILENGCMRYLVEGKYNEDAEPGTDFQAVVDGYVSVGKVRNVG